MSDAHTNRGASALPWLRLTDGVVDLRPLCESDASEMAAAADDGHYVAWGPMRGPVDERQALAFVREWESGRLAGRRLALAVARTADGVFVGSAMLMVSGEAEAELAYWIRQEARGRGYATRALRLLADQAEVLGFRRLWLEIEPHNEASQRVAAAADFLAEGRRCCDLGDGPTECVIFVRSAPVSPLPAGYTVRRPLLADADAVLAVMNAAEVADSGEPETARAGLLADWQGLPHFDLARDTWLIEAFGGAPVAYVWAWDERPHEWLITIFWILPSHRHSGLEEHILELVERRAVEHAAEAPGRSSDLAVVCLSTDAARRELYRQRGFRHVRSFERMSIDLTAPLATPFWPHGIEVRRFRRGRDEAAVHDAMDDAFSEHFRDTPLPLDEWERLVFADTRLDPDLWFVAWDGDRVAGAVLSYSMKEPGIDCGCVDQLGVRKPWRNHGLGTALLLRALSALQERGHTRATLGVDTANVTAAQRLYEGVGMQVERRIDVFEKRVVEPPAS